MGKKIRRIALLLGLLLLLGGCLSQGGEEFYALPQLPQDYLALQETINEVISELGAEYAAPASGSNSQNIQMQDLDGDGTRETAVAFFRVTSTEKPLKIYFFRQNPASGEYETAWIIEGEGTGIYSVSFDNLGGTADKEVIISWQISSTVRSLAAYSLQYDSNAVELMRSGYTRYALMDMTEDNEKEIILVHLDTVENSSNAELYDYDAGVMVMKSQVHLSMNITAVQAAKAGNLSDNSPALFVTSAFGENAGRVTDIITMRDGALCNLTLNENSGMSTSTVRYYSDFGDVNGKDIDGDGVLELPMPEELPPVNETATRMYVLHWYQYSPEGAAIQVCTTFHCYDDSWYIVLPDEWQGQISAVRQESFGSTAASERAITFYHYETETGEDGEEQIKAEQFLTVYRLTGTNRTFRAALEGRFVIIETTDVIYAARFWASKWDCGLTEETFYERFNRIVTAWSAEN